MREVEAVKTGEQRQQVEAHLADQGGHLRGHLESRREHRLAYLGSVVVGYLPSAILAVLSWPWLMYVALIRHNRRSTSSSRKPVSTGRSS